MKLANGGNGATVYILSWEITQYNRLTQFFLCCGGVFLLYIVYGYLQELIFTDVAFKSFGWFLTLIQFGYYICFGFIERNIRGRVNGLNGRTMERAIPIRIYVILAALTLGTMGLSNSSLRYINFPTQVIFKCCKLIPVLVGSIIVQGKRYGILDFVAASLMCIGLAWFALVDSHISPSFHVMGVAMILGALLCDAMIGNVQEKAMRDYNGNSAEVVLYSYGFGFMYLLVILAMTGHLLDGLLFSFEVFVNLLLIIIMINLKFIYLFLCCRIMVMYSVTDSYSVYLVTLVYILC